MLIWKILKEALEKGASDVMLSPNSHPCLKVNWEVLFLDNYEIFSREELNKEVLWIMKDFQKEDFLKNLELDFWVDLKGYSRFRVNAFVQKNWYGAVFRPIKSLVPSFKDLYLPKEVLDLTKNKNGLILITWAVWSGKSTTLASLIDHINNDSNKHIITIEDPIEFVFDNKNCLIDQREVWTNTLSFYNWLKYALRQSSDVVMIWEMRDLDTFRLALRAAETWNLVFATLHTSWAARTVSRIIDMFPAEEKEQIKAQLSESLVWVVWQDLIKRKDWKWRVVSTEVLVNNVSISNMIRKGLVHQIDGVIETSVKDGMIPMKKSLENLYSKWFISKEDLFYNLEHIWKIL